MAMPVYIVIAGVGAIDLGTAPSEATISGHQSTHGGKPSRVVR